MHVRYSGVRWRTLGSTGCATIVAIPMQGRWTPLVAERRAVGEDGSGMSTTVRGILSEKGAAVFAVAPDASVFEALERLAEHDVGALVVVEGEALVGVVSERDYARKVILAGRASRDTPVRDVMSAPVITADIDDTVNACMARMADRRIRHLPVLDQGRLAGMVSVGDLVKAIIAEQAFEIEQLQGYIAGTG